MQERRRAMGLTQMALARLVGMTWGQIRWTEGQRRRVKPDEAKRIAAVMDVPVGDLFPEVRT